jgi:hypothetical protein
MSSLSQPFTEEELSPARDVPHELVAATARLSFPPSYVVVGAYRMLSDKSVLVPVWNKCKHAFVRGVALAGIWVHRFAFTPINYLLLT